MENKPENISVLIVDDDKLSREVLKTALAEFDWIDTPLEAENMSYACEIMSQETPDIVFLDIELNDESALDSLNEMHTMSEGHSRIVFYTSYRKYLMQALRMKAFDFLLKPIDMKELTLILNRYKLEKANDGDRIAGVDTYDRNCGHQSGRGYSTGISMTTMTNDRLILSPRDIVFFRYDSERKFWEAVLTNLQHLILKRNTTADTILNYGSDFVRTHKSYIVNVAYISMISGNECRLIPPFNALADIKISKIYRRPLLDRFYDL